MSFIRGKNIIFGESFVFESENETNIVSDNSLPIIQDATVLDELFILIDKINNYVYDDHCFSVYNQLLESISNLISNSCSIPVKYTVENDIKDYVYDDMTYTN